MKLISIQVGKPREVAYRNRTITTGIFKDPVSGPVFVRTLNLDGDGQADLKVHGGVDKAVYGYSLDAYPWWKAQRPADIFSYGAFGENLCIEKINESKVFIGDVFEIGVAKLMAVQPRFPCFKLGLIFNDMHILKTFNESGRPGIYFRVVKEGKIQSGDELRLVDREQDQISVADIFRISLQEDISEQEARQALAVKSLPSSLREQFQEVLDRMALK
jgi:MOSC domain-containing protein YiiM